jgi:hypothetical protein
MKLKTLSINQKDGVDALFLEELVQSQQAQYIQDLSLRNILPEPMNLMHTMEGLTSLEIKCSIANAEFDCRPTKTIDFSQLIQNCPVAVTDLVLGGVDLECYRLTTNQTSIQRLELQNVTIQSFRIENILKTSIPKLSVLVLCAIIESSLTISLPGYHLERVELDLGYPDGAPCELSIKTIKDGKPHLSKECPSDDGRSIFRNKVYFSCDSVEELHYCIERVYISNYNDDDTEYDEEEDGYDEDDEYF